MAAPALNELPKVASDLKNQLEGFSVDKLKNTDTNEKCVLPSAEEKGADSGTANGGTQENSADKNTEVTQDTGDNATGENKAPTRSALNRLKRKRRQQRLRGADGNGPETDSKDDVKRPRTGEDESDSPGNEKYVVKISDKGAPGGKINEIRGAILRSRIVAAVDDAIKWRMFVPRFKNSKFVRGFYQIRCADMTSLFWLRKTVSEMPPLWRGCILDVLVREETLRKKRIIAYFPGSPDPVNLIMPRIMAQNVNLNTERWDIFDRKVDGPRGQTLIFGLDEETIDLLKKNDFKVYCGVHLITFRLADEDQNKATNGGTAETSQSPSAKRYPGKQYARFPRAKPKGRRVNPNDSNKDANASISSTTDTTSDNTASQNVASDNSASQNIQTQAANEIAKPAE